MKSAAGGMSSARKGCMESFRRNVCYQADEIYTLARDAMLRGAQITSNGLCPLITYQSFGLITFTALPWLHTRLRRNYIPPSADFIHGFAVIWMRRTRKENEMTKNLLLEYSEELATKCELLCKSISGNSNTVFQFRKSSSSVFANITEAQYPQSLADMLSKFKIARKECAETESWLKLLYNTKTIDEETFKTYRNLCGRIQRMLTSSCITIEKKIDNK